VIRAAVREGVDAKLERPRQRLAAERIPTIETARHPGAFHETKQNQQRRSP
jgi:hypothetical protein